MHNVCSVAFLCVLFLSTVTAVSEQNITIAVPAGTTDHGDDSIICTPISWTDIATFFLGNYLSHVATVRSAPGESLPETILTAVSAFFFPGAGVVKGIDAILRFAAFEKDPLAKAARAGALCMVIRSDTWTPIQGQVVQGVTVKYESKSMGESARKRDTHPDATNSQQTDLPAFTVPEPPASSPSIAAKDVQPLPRAYSTAANKRVHEVQRNSSRPSDPDDLATRNLAFRAEQQYRVDVIPWVDRSWRIFPFRDKQLRKVDHDKRGFLRLFSMSITFGNHIKGSYSLPEGYAFAFVPGNAIVVPKPILVGNTTEDGIENDIQEAELLLSAAYSPAKSIVAVIQAIFASATLYQARGNQIQLAP